MNHRETSSPEPSLAHLQRRLCFSVTCNFALYSATFSNSAQYRQQFYTTYLTRHTGHGWTSDYVNVTGCHRHDAKV